MLLSAAQVRRNAIDSTQSGRHCLPSFHTDAGNLGLGFENGSEAAWKLQAVFFFSDLNERKEGPLLPPIEWGTETTGKNSFLGTLFESEPLKDRKKVRHSVRTTWSAVTPSSPFVG